VKAEEKYQVKVNKKIFKQEYRFKIEGGDYIEKGYCFIHGSQLTVRIGLKMIKGEFEQLDDNQILFMVKQSTCLD
jgi:hypothetical protein